jgi:hypothetical protein
LPLSFVELAAGNQLPENASIRAQTLKTTLTSGFSTTAFSPLCIIIGFDDEDYLIRKWF